MRHSRGANSVQTPLELKKKKHGTRHTQASIYPDVIRCACGLILVNPRMCNQIGYYRVFPWRPDRSARGAPNSTHGRAGRPAKGKRSGAGWPQCARSPLMSLGRGRADGSTAECRMGCVLHRPRPSLKPDAHRSPIRGQDLLVGSGGSAFCSCAFSWPWQPQFMDRVAVPALITTPRIVVVVTHRAAHAISALNVVQDRTRTALTRWAVVHPADLSERHQRGRTLRAACASRGGRATMAQVRAQVAPSTNIRLR